MGPRREIILYENLRPVRCHKIRYYTDKRFTQRLLPPPPLQPNDLSDAARSRTDDHFGLWQDKVVQGSRGAPLRAGQLAADRVIKQAGGEAFSLDFSEVTIPDGRTLTSDEINRAVDAFLDGLVTA